MSNSNLLNPATLLSSSDQRLTLQATLQPVGNIERFQPAGFPEIGHVIYDAPRAVMETKKEEDGTETEIHAKDENGDPKWTTDKVCIVDSAASMANHLETVCLAGPFGAGLADELKGLPYVECVTDGDKPGAHRLVVTTFSEGHRLASSLFTDEKNSRLLKGGKRSNENLGTNLLNEFGLVDLGKRSHPLPQDWWNVFKTIFKYDPNSLVHGIFFPAMGIRIPRLLTAHLEAFGAARVASAGVKFDKLLMTTSGQPIFAVDEETAHEIRATFVIDLALLRSFGRMRCARRQRGGPRPERPAETTPARVGTMEDRTAVAATVSLPLRMRSRTQQFAPYRCRCRRETDNRQPQHRHCYSNSRRRFPGQSGHTSPLAGQRDFQEGQG